MAIDLDKLYNLLPAIYRIRDDEQGTPVKQLLAVIAEQIAVLEEDLAQLYDDQFIETAANWAVPYIGDLIGYRPLNGVVPQIASPRAEVANTIGYRRRKGTASVLEELAHAVTGWEAHAVEFFRLLATTQYMNHIRPQNRVTPHLGKGIAFTPSVMPPNWERLERLNGAFDTVAHTLDVRHISSGRGKYNIPNIGISLWRLRAYSLTKSPAMPDAPGDTQRFRFDPLGFDRQLFTNPVTEDEVTHLAEPINVPEPLHRRVLYEELEARRQALVDGKEISTYYFGVKPMFEITFEGEAHGVPFENIAICNLSQWRFPPGQKKYRHRKADGTFEDVERTIDLAVDPELGRIAFAQPVPAGKQVLVTFHYGFSGDLGGGEYSRSDTFTPADNFPADSGQVVNAGQHVQDALNAVMAHGGTVQIQDSGRYEETLSINAGANATIELRAADGARPHLHLQHDFLVNGADTSVVVLNGLLISGLTVRAGGNLGTLILRHCTLVPGVTLDINGTPQAPTTPSLVIEMANTSVEIDHCIVGGIRAHPETNVNVTNSIVDATDATGVAFAALDDESAGGELTIENSTAIGKVHTRLMQLASNSIFLASLSPTDTWNAPVLSERKQEGCVRFSYVPPGSRTPRRFKCQPASGVDPARVRPQFTSLRYGDPGYGQLSRRCAIEIRAGADDDAEMGAFHELYQPQRESNLRTRLDEYLRFGLEAGIFYAT